MLYTYHCAKAHNYIDLNELKESVIAILFLVLICILFGDLITIQWSIGTDRGSAGGAVALLNILMRLIFL